MFSFCYYCATAVERAGLFVLTVCFSTRQIRSVFLCVSTCGTPAASVRHWGIARGECRDVAVIPTMRCAGDLSFVHPARVFRLLLYACMLCVAQSTSTFYCACVYVRARVLQSSLRSPRSPCGARQSALACPDTRVQHNARLIRKVRIAVDTSRTWLLCRSV